MKKRSVTREAGDHVIEWSKKEPWNKRWPEFQQNILKQVGERQGITADQLQEDLSDPTSAGILFAVLFEYFMEIEFGEEPCNIVDNYLQRRGWKEAPQGRTYLQLLRDTPFSLYEVLDVKPGQSVTVQDLLRPLPEAEVIEILGSQQISPADTLLLKVIELDGQFHFSGALSIIPDYIVYPLADKLKEAMHNAGLTLRPENYAQEANAIQDSLHGNALEMINALMGYLAKPFPELFTEEGHPILVTEIHIPVHDAERVITTLNQHPEFERTDSETEDRPFWNWILPEEAKTAQKLSTGAMTLQSTLLSGEGNCVSVRGTLELTAPNKLYCSLMSRERGEVLVNVLEPLLNDAVGIPMTTYQALQKTASKGGKGRKESAALELSAEETEEMLIEFLDQHYRNLLDTEIPALNGTPREIVKTEEGKAETAKWLRYLEAGQTRAKANKLPEYDFSWMWQALGIEHLKSVKLPLK